MLDNIQTLSTIVGKELRILCYSNNTLKFSATFTDADNNPINLTGYTFSLQVRTRGATVNTLKTTFTTSDGTIVIVGDDSNTLLFSKLIDFDGGDYRYDLTALLPDTTKATFMFGEFKVLQNISTNI